MTRTFSSALGRMTLQRVALTLLAALLTVAGPASAASRYDPALRFRTLATQHFFIYFHQGEHALARRFAAIAEQVHAQLSARLATAPAGPTHVILVDQNDTANGWATPLPYDTIEITVGPPAPSSLIGNTDDWLRLVFTHEYTHILHLDRSRGYASVARTVFGRSPLSFPNLYLPAWQTEGLATYEESVATGQGRVNAGDFRLLVSQASLRRLALDRASSDIDDWPGGNSPYAYGGFFHRFLAERYGDEKFAELSRLTAGRFYFLASPAFKETFGKSLGDLWSEFEASQGAASPRVGKSESPRVAASERPSVQEADRSSTAASGTNLTNQGFVVAGPRFVEDSGGRSRIVYSSRTGDDFPSLRSVDLQGRVRRVTSRYSGEQISVVGRFAVFDQIDLWRSVALRSDLYEVDLASGHVERLTTGGRFLEPALSADGSVLACVRLLDGQRRLAVFDLPAGAWPGDVRRLRRALRARPRFELAGDAVDYSSPRWSPDGRSLAVSRLVRGAGSQVALVDGRTGALSVIVASSDARNVTPTWTPDGARLVFASDRGGGPFNLYAVTLPDGAVAQRGALPAGVAVPVTQLTDVPTGATYPDVSPDGRLLTYVGYTAAGYDVFVRPLDASRSGEGRGASGERNAGSGSGEGRGARGERSSNAGNEAQNGSVTDAEYRPWRTLLPRYWMPAFESSDQQLKIGAATSGNDVLGRHLYAATFLARIAGEPGAAGSPRYDWAAGYTYDRWVPSFFVDASDRTHFLRDVLLPAGTVAASDLREQSEEIGVFVPSAHVRYQQGVTAAVNFTRQTLNIGGLGGARSDRNALRFAWSLNSAKTYAYSISPEQGATLGATSEFVRTALGADANAGAATIDGRAYIRLGGGHTILAVRAAFGRSWGDARTRRTFYLGGSGPNDTVTGFGGDALNLLRGFDLNEFAGTRVAVANLEYRLPVLRVERGLGTWPIFLRTLHATAFADVGTAWTVRFSRNAVARGVGGELSANVRLGYELPLTASLGIAWPREPVGGTRAPVAYFRIGRAF